MNAIERHFVEDGWMVLYSNRIYALLATDERCKAEKNHDSWITCSSMARPSFDYDDGKSKISGYRPFPEDGAFPIVYSQEEKCYHRERVRLIDEFVLLYNLRLVERTDGSLDYYAVGKSGEDYLVAKYKDGVFRIKQEYIQEFIAIKGLWLVLQFETSITSKSLISEFNTPNKDLQLYDCGDIIFSYHLFEYNWEDDKTCALLRGKIFLKPEEGNIKRLWDPKDDRKETFIIGADKNGASIISTCDESKLPALGEFDAAKPWQLSFVFFKDTVLDKYQSNSRVYEVQDGALSGPDWFVHVDNDRQDGYVVMALKDLGKMPYSEQCHWKEYNIVPPKGVSLSDTTWNRWIEGNPCNTQNEPGLLFKELYHELDRVWTNKFGVPLFLPLADGDKHYLDEIHSMSSLYNDTIFDNLVLSFAKVTIDSINELEIFKLIDENNPDIKEQLKGSPLKTVTKGISRLELCFISSGIRGEGYITLLHKIQALRSATSAHRKSQVPKNRDKKLMEWFGLDVYPQKDVLDYILQMYINEFNQLITEIEGCVYRHTRKGLLNRIWSSISKFFLRGL